MSLGLLKSTKCQRLFLLKACWSPYLYLLAKKEKMLPPVLCQIVYGMAAVKAPDSIALSMW